MIIKNLQKNKGFVILFAVTISAILLSIALGVSNIAFQEAKFSTSAKNTNDAFFAADAGAECALAYYMKTSLNAFSVGSDQLIECTGIPTTAMESFSSYWSFVISSLGEGGQGCAKISVDKTVSLPISAIIISKGYNVGNSLCEPLTPNQNRVERELRVTL
jgi:hypothetical protein